MTVNEAAKHYGVSVRTIRRWCADGRIPAQRIGKEWEIESLPDIADIADVRMSEPADIADTGDVRTEALDVIEARLARIEGVLAGQFMSELSGQVSELRTSVSATVSELIQELREEREASRSQQETLLELMQANHEEEERRAAEQTAQLEALRAELAELKKPWWKWWLRREKANG